MISFDLKCVHGHVFEAWFRSSGDYDDQSNGGLIACPICGDAEVAKAVMAPAVSAKGNRNATAAPIAMANDGPNDAQIKALMAALAEAQSQMLEKSEWVGDSFAEKARAMHYGETEQAAIHGTTNARDAREMMEEGVPVAPLIVPVAPPDGMH